MAELLADTDFWKAIASMLWPVVAIIIFFSVRQKLSALLTRENLTIKVAGMEISVADATKNLGLSVSDLQKRLGELENKFGGPKIAAAVGSHTATGDLVAIAPEGKATPPAAPSRSFAILWVDDFPSNNAFVIEQFQNDGLDVQLALSTAEGLSKLENYEFDVIITDLGRMEGGIDNRFAGMDLIKKVRAQDKNIPILVYAGQRGYQNRAKLIDAGATNVFQSTVELQRTIQAFRGRKRSK